MRRPMTPYRFFLAHAGYSYGPTERPIDGRRRCARDLAAAERLACDAGLTFEWRDDDQPFECGCDDPTCASHEPHRAYGCVLRDADGRVQDSLWGISFGPDVDPWGQPYARVVQAELASEYFARTARIAA